MNTLPKKVHIIKMNKSSNFYGIYNKESKNAFKSNIVYFSKAKDAQIFRQFLVKYMKTYKEAPELKYFNYRHDIFKSYEHSKECVFKERIEDYFEDFVVDFDSLDQSFDSETNDSPRSYEDIIEICKFERNFLDFFMSVNNLGSIECAISKKGAIKIMGKEKRLECTKEDYKEYLEWSITQNI
jgi:hypothetical protein